MHPAQILLVAVLPSVALAQARFAGEVFPMPAPPKSVATADLDGDGALDALSPLSGLPQALLVSPNPVLGTPIQVMQPLQLTVAHGTLADVNGDGLADEIFCGLNSSQVEAHINAGGLSFSGPILSGISANANMSAVGDLNADGYADLAVVGSSGSFVQVGHGTGTGAFSFAQPAAAGSGSGRIVLVDFDGDGFLEVVTAQFNAKTLAYFDAANSPTFLSLAWNTPTSGSPYDLAVGDFDIDGRADVVTAVAGAIGAEANLSSYGVGPTIGLVPVGIGELTLAVAVAPLLPGAPTSIVLLTPGNRIWKCEYTGAAQFSKASMFIGGEHVGLALGDSNLDAIQDLFVACNNPAGLMVAPLDAAAEPHGVEKIDAGFPVSDVLATDTNGDGRPDLLGSSRAYLSVPPPNSRIAVALGSPGGLLGAIQTGKNVPLGYTTHLVAGDLSNDGIPDLVQDAAHFVSQVLSGNGDGTFVVQFQLLATGSPTLIRSPFEPAIADITGDGLPDALIMSHQKLLQGYSGLFFGGQPLVLNLVNWPAEVTKVELGDADLDGDLDLYSSGLGNVQMHRWDGIVFTPISTYPIGTQLVADLEVFDYSKDGIPDVAVSHGGSTFESIYASTILGLRGLPGGALASAVPMGLPVLSTCAALEAADLDSDGAPELLTVNSKSSFGAYPGSIMIARVDANGSATVSNVLAGATTMHDVEVFDYDLDGRMDLAFSAGSQDSHMWVYKNVGANPGNVSTLGVGTQGCLGSIRMAAHGTVAQGQPLRISATQVASGIGLGILSDVSDPAGSDPFFLVLKLHVGFATPNLVPFDFPAPLGGTATAVLPPLPVNPALNGTVWNLQSIWVGDPKRGDTCSQATFELQSSNLLTISL